VPGDPVNSKPNNSGWNLFVIVYNLNTWSSWLTVSQATKQYRRLTCPHPPLWQDGARQFQRYEQVGLRPELYGMFKLYHAIRAFTSDCGYARWRYWRMQKWHSYQCTINTLTPSQLWCTKLIFKLGLGLGCQRERHGWLVHVWQMRLIIIRA
jgi:hypothetical protein